MGSGTGERFVWGTGWAAEVGTTIMRSLGWRGGFGDPKEPCPGFAVVAVAVFSSLAAGGGSAGGTAEDHDRSSTKKRGGASARAGQKAKVNGGKMAAGQAALANGAWAEAETAFRAALANGESAEALDGLGEAAWWLDDAETAFSSRERAYHLYRQGGDNVAAARVAMQLATDHFALRGEPAVASGWFQRAAHLLEGLPPVAEHGWLGVWEAHVALLGSEPRAARPRIAQALEVGRAFGVIELEMLAVAQDGLAMVSQGDVETGIRRLDEAAVAATSGELRDRRVVFTTYCYLLNACRQVGDFERVAEWNNAISGEADRWACPAPFATCRVDYAPVLLWRGAWSQAEQQLEKVLSDAATRPGPAAAAAVGLAELRRRQGRHSEAAELVARAASTRGARPLQAELTVARAELALDEWDAATAATLAERFLRSPQSGRHWDRLRALSLLVRAQLSLGEPDEAKATLDQLRSVVAPLPSGAPQAHCLLAEGIAAAAGGELERARQRLEDAVALFEDTGAAYETAQARLELAAALAALGRLPGAAREAAAALAVLGPLGAADAKRAEALLARVEAKETTTEPGEAPQLVLTPRELEVLRLIALGRSNREIAQELVLSARTVERHVSNIYRSLGASGKAARAVAIRTALRSGLLQQF